MVAGVKEVGYAALNAALSVPGQYHMAASYSCGSLTDETFDPEMDKQLDNAFGTTDPVSYTHLGKHYEKKIYSMYDRSHSFNSCTDRLLRRKDR